MHYTKCSSDLHAHSVFSPCYIVWLLQTEWKEGLEASYSIFVSPSLCASSPRVLQPSRVRLGSSWRCRLRSVPSVQREATPSAAASASTNGIPCPPDSVAWQPRWKTVPTETTGSPATGLWGASKKKWKPDSECKINVDMFCLAVLPGCLKETIWSPTGMNARSLSSTPSIWRNGALSALSTSIQTTTCCLSSLWVGNIL